MECTLTRMRRFATRLYSGCVTLVSVMIYFTWVIVVLDIWVQGGSDVCEDNIWLCFISNRLSISVRPLLREIVRVVSRDALSFARLAALAAFALVSRISFTFSRAMI